MIVRMSNFECHDDVYTANDSEGYTRTMNYLCDLDDDLQIVKATEISEEDITPVWPWVQNMEDARLFHHYETWYALGTSRQHRPDGAPQMALDVLGSDGEILVRSILPMQRGSECEKNWVAINQDYFIVDISERTLYNHFDRTFRYDVMPFDTPGLRGGSQLVSLGSSHEYNLSVAHRVLWEPERAKLQGSSRNYEHLFVGYDRDHFAIRASEPFHFIDPGIEFCAGLVEWNDYYVASFGYRDREAYLAFLPISEVRKQLA